MLYRKTEYIAGDVYEAEITPLMIGSHPKRRVRGENVAATSEQQRRINDRLARRKLARVVNANFGRGDLFVTLTHADEISEADARKALANYLRRVKRWRERRGKSKLKYVAVTEDDGKRVHHHVLISGGGMTMDEATGLWYMGRTMASRLDGSADYTGIAKYITKEPRRPHQKRWSQSRNLAKPRERHKRIKHGDKLAMPPRGYKIVERQVYASDYVGGTIQYIKALRIGGVDYAEGGMGDANGSAYMQEMRKTNDIH